MNRTTIYHVQFRDAGESDKMIDLFSPVCCWSCVHCILDIGEHSDKRQYRCTNKNKDINHNPHLPTECDNWNK